MKIKQEWKIRANEKSFQYLVSQTKEIICNANEKGKMACSWSGGKDSTAMTHLIKTLYPNTPVITQFDDCDWKEKREYIDVIDQKYHWGAHFVAPDFSVWARALQYKIGYENLCSPSHALTKDSFLSVLKQKQKDLCCDVICIGLRSDESYGRKMNFRKRGMLYKTKDNEWKCCPISKWKAIDVFAYLVVNEIEINPCYFYNRFFQPEEIRLSWSLPTAHGICRGDMQHLRYYYPEQYRKLRGQGIE